MKNKTEAMIASAQARGIKIIDLPAAKVEVIDFVIIDVNKLVKNNASEM